MKELSIEQKAEAYDRALEYAKSALDCLADNYICHYLTKDDIIGIYAKLFPEISELKKDEDEKIKRAIIEGLKEMKSSFHTISSVKIDDAIGWLEKQNKQKPVDEVKPNFKIGDWIICCNYEPVQIISIRTNAYEMSNGDIRPFWMVDNNDNIRLWTVEDTKVGDVLVDEDNNIGIYKEIEGLYWNSYIYLGCDGKLRGFSIGGSHKQANTRPATKEQRDLLFQKMKEAGYEWDVEEKKLKKIEDEEYNGEDYGIDSLWHAQRILEKTLGSVEGYQSDDGILEHKCAISAVKKLYEQKSDWSKEDEMFVHGLIRGLSAKRDIHGHTTFSSDCIDITETIDWLKSIKDRVNPKQEWSEEDERYN